MKNENNYMMKNVAGQRYNSLAKSGRQTDYVRMKTMGVRWANGKTQSEFDAATKMKVRMIMTQMKLNDAWMN